mmetsp:Transcript_51184/g.87726  ORF Transcript_51184/g.87726 Transcript_51184/m.87726 type:complete len:261 (+) Transcript_51184:194-976(+)
MYTPIPMAHSLKKSPAGGLSIAHGRLRSSFIADFRACSLQAACWGCSLWKHHWRLPKGEAQYDQNNGDGKFGIRNVCFRRISGATKQRSVASGRHHRIRRRVSRGRRHHSARHGQRRQGEPLVVLQRSRREKKVQRSLRREFRDSAGLRPYNSGGDLDVRSRWRGVRCWPPRVKPRRHLDFRSGAQVSLEGELLLASGKAPRVRARRVGLVANDAQQGRRRTRPVGTLGVVTASTGTSTTAQEAPSRVAERPNLRCSSTA